MNCDAKMHIKNKTDVNGKNNFYCLPYLSQIGKSTAKTVKSNTNKVQPPNRIKKADKCEME